MTRTRTITIDGIEYPSVSAAARALVLTRQAIYNRLWARGHADEMPIGRPMASYPVAVDGVTYDNIHVAAVLTGVSRHALAWRKRRYGTYDTPPRSRHRRKTPRKWYEPVS